MKKYANIFMLICFAASLSGCAVGMALSGKREPEMNALKKGMHMDEVHFIMRDYTPAVNFTETGGRIESYEIQLGNAPSGGRALGHLAMDVMTLGTWEIIGTPVEGASSSKTTLIITYDENDTVKTLKAGKTQNPI